MAEQNLPQVLSGVVGQCRTEHAAALDELAGWPRGCKAWLSADQLTETGGTAIMTASDTEVRGRWAIRPGGAAVGAAPGESIASYTFVQL
jgi:hypothetical protein